MKKIITATATLALLIFFSSCKKTNEIKPAVSQADDELSLAVTNNTNKVVTIAGHVNSSGFMDGTANVARFNAPMGIQLLKDGTLYVADRYNNAVRKISPDGVVSTETLKTPEEEYGLIQPMYVGKDARKNLHVVCATDGDAYSHSFIFDSQRVFLEEHSVPYSVESCLAKDPYYDVFWFSSGHSVGVHTLYSDPTPGSSQGFDADEFFPPFSSRGSSFKGLFVGRNKVIYFSAGGSLFKHTPSGVTARIYETLQPGSITSIVLNADSKTMYLAADGYIEKIVNGKLTKLAGPNATNPDGRDGIGFKADVNAFSLALGDHENVLYFSDTKTNTIRKLMLK